MLSNMTSAFDVDFECPTHITGTLDFENPPRSPLRGFSSKVLVSCLASASLSHLFIRTRLPSQFVISPSTRTLPIQSHSRSIRGFTERTTPRIRLQRETTTSAPLPGGGRSSFHTEGNITASGGVTYPGIGVGNELLFCSRSHLCPEE